MTSQRDGGTVTTRAASSTPAAAVRGARNAADAASFPQGDDGGQAQRRHHQADRLVADGEAEADQRAGDPADALLLQAAHQEHQAGHRTQDLRVVMVDAARPELHERHHRQHHQRHREHGRPWPGTTESFPGDHQLQDEEQQRRPDHARGDLGAFGAEQRPEQQHQQRKRRIDQPRPVRDQRLGCADARQRGVEPGRAASSSRTRDEAHRIVGVAQPVRQRRRVAAGQQHEQQRCRQRTPGSRHGRDPAQARTSQERRAAHRGSEICNAICRAPATLRASLRERP